MLGLALSLLLPLQPDLPQTAPRDEAIRVRDILIARCAQCHGTHLAKPRGKFGFIDDLARLREDPDFLVPGEPDDSEVWVQIADGKMPPKKSRAVPLSDQEKQAVHDWIKSGAILPADMPPAPPPPPTESQQPARPWLTRVSTLMGKFHVLTIHFPISLLAAAAVGEVLAALRRDRAPWPAVRYCLWLGVLGAVVSSALGWVHAFYGSGEGDEYLTLHRWIGTGAAALAPLVLWAAERDVCRNQRRAAVRWAIIGLAVLVGVAAHFGGLMVYGGDYFSF